MLRVLDMLWGHVLEGAVSLITVLSVLQRCVLVSAGGAWPCAGPLRMCMLVRRMEGQRGAARS